MKSNVIPEEAQSYSCVAASSRIRLARNFADYPFPAMLMKDAHGREMAAEMIQIVEAELCALEKFTVYRLSDVTDKTVSYLVNRHLVSKDLVNHRDIAAALVSEDESICVMVNEEDHLREQVFVEGYDLAAAYERILAVDETLSRAVPFAHDDELGFLTACPSNLGTGMRASVMLFLPALSRRGKLREIGRRFSNKGLTLRGAFGEGSAGEGDLFQISNEVTLGYEEWEIIDRLTEAVEDLVGYEMNERICMKLEEGDAIHDAVVRAYGTLLYSYQLGEKELVRCLSDVKLGLALGFIRPCGTPIGERLRALDAVASALRILIVASTEEQDIVRAREAGKMLRAIPLEV